MGMETGQRHIIPIMTQNNASPEELLQIDNFNYFLGCKSSRCSCRRHGLPCTAVCGTCQTENCKSPNNSQVVTEEEDEGELIMSYIAFDEYLSSWRYRQFKLFLVSQN
ncbi:hypothetical protein DPMN_117718 [Dreissena polymorpha]|uniref:Uncharacterized protein n=1 Tax=Dreissena polymorpha TaxID=45954 RepID=A0A9D4GIR7_DREPO|nr:hypothetical protein DPMN_117718 [Dreissena polymorpha]